MVRFLLLVVAALLASTSFASAYYMGTSWRNTAYASYSPYTTSHYAVGYRGGAWIYDGQSGLTTWGPYPYAASARLSPNLEARGHYSPYAMRYVDGMSMRYVPQAGYISTSNSIPARSYPYIIQGVHRE
jgi:hypothetical protein